VRVLTSPGDTPFILPGNIQEVGSVLGMLNEMALQVRPFLGNIQQAKSLMWLDAITAADVSCLCSLRAVRCDLLLF